MRHISDYFCVIIRRKDGTEFLAHANDGMAVYWNKKSALALAKDLRKHKMRARVERTKIAVTKKGKR